MMLTKLIFTNLCKTGKDAFPTGNPTFADELNYETQDPAAVSMSYRSDYWIEELV